MVIIILLVLSLVCFLLAAFGSAALTPRVNTTALGLALYVLAQLWPLLVR